MPELPEVETTRRGLESALLDQTVTRVIVRQPRLRWRVSAALARALPGQRIRAVERRAKYLLLRTSAAPDLPGNCILRCSTSSIPGVVSPATLAMCRSTSVVKAMGGRERPHPCASHGTVIIHLGMSGSLRVIPHDMPPTRHDHVDIVLANGACLRLRDPRRFGAVLWTARDPAQHKLLKGLGPEPLGPGFTAGYLYAVSRRRKLATRDFLLNGRIVAGVGNIYANESLFLAGIRPTRAAGRLKVADCERLVEAIRRTLEKAIRAGGTTLRDFSNTDGRPGYFQQMLNVYGQNGNPCPRCGNAVRSVRLGNRGAFYCSGCQL